MIIAVKFKPDNSTVYQGSEYIYKTDEYVQAGDEVIVNTIPDRRNLRVAMVSRILDTLTLIQDEIEEIEEVVQVVDTKRYMNKKKNKEHIKRLKDILDSKVKTYQQNVLYEALAERDEDFREVYLTYLQAMEGVIQSE